MALCMAAKQLNSIPVITCDHPFILGIEIILCCVSFK